MLSGTVTTRLLAFVLAARSVRNRAFYPRNAHGLCAWTGNFLYEAPTQHAAHDTR
jgi:hypothetical protein